MKELKKELSKVQLYKIVFIAALVWAMVFGVLNTLTNLKKEKHFYEDRKQTEHYAEALRTSVERELNSLMFISNGLSSYIAVYKDELESSKLNAILADLWGRAKYVRNLGVTVGYEFKYVYPVAGNEKIIGVNLQNVHAQWPKLKRAIEAREAVMDGPLELIQGGNGIVYRYPVFIKDKLWGIISTVINTKPFLDAAFQHSLNDNYEFAIRTENGDVFYGDPDLFNNSLSTVIDSSLPNGKWEWAIKSRITPRPTKFYVLEIFSILIPSIIAFALYYYLHERNNLTKEALIDSLTNLPNRRFLDKAMLKASDEAKRKGELIGLMIIDLDHFKRINDTNGHAFGDAALLRVAETIQSKIRDTDILSRVGGDEFVLLLGGLSSVADARNVADKIIDAFAAEQTIHGIQIQLSLSIGLSTSLFDEKINIKQLFKQADEALYKAKHEGRGRYKVYDPEPIKPLKLKSGFSPS